MGFSLKEFLNLNNKQKQQAQQPQPASTSQPRGGFSITNNPITRGASRAYDQVNMFDNNRTWQQTDATNNKNLWQQAIQPVKTVAKPFWETADYAKNTIQVPLSSMLGDQETANRAKLNRDQSYQESYFAPTITQTYNALSRVPVIENVIPGASVRNDVEKRLERNLQDTQRQLDTNTDAQLHEISSGIKSGLYDPQKGQEAIQQLLLARQAPTQVLDELYNQQLNSAGLDKNMSTAQAYAKTYGNIAGVASLGIAPMSGSTLRTLPANQMLRAGATDLIANATLGGIGTGTSAYGSGASFGDSLKAGAGGAALSIPLMGAGYINGVHAPTVNAAAGKVKPTTKLVINNPDNAKIAPLPINNPDGARIGGLQINNPEGASVTPTTKLLRVRNPDNAKIAPTPLSGAAQQSNLAKNRFGLPKLGEEGFVKIPGKKELPITGPALPKPKQSRFASGVTRSAEISPELQASVKKTNATYVPIENADMVKASQTLVKKGYKKAVVDVTSRLEKKLGRIDGQDVADTIHVIKELDKRGGTANLQQATALSEKLSQHLTKAGQTVQAASILNNRTPEGMLYGARKFLKSHSVEVTPEIQKALKGKVDEIAKMKPSEARSYKIAELQQMVSQYVPSSNLEKVVGLWKAGLLTGIKTQTGNTLSGIATNVIKTASDAPAALLDEGFTAFGKTKVGQKLGFTGEHSKSFTLRGKASGAYEGGVKGLKSLKTGIDERNLEANKFDTKRLVFSKSKLGRVAQRYTDSVYGLMGAADRPNYYSNLRNNLYDLAITDAKNKGLKGAQREAHIQKFVSEPPMKALETANKAAETAIFANDTALSRIAGGILKKADDSGPVVGAAAKVVLPFTKVPSAVATRLVDYSPAGAIKTVAEQIKNVKKGGKIDQRALSEGLAQSGVGTGTMYLGMKLREAGLMTGSYPTDQKERELWKLEGKQENSIKVGDKWLSFNYTSPVGQVLAVGGKVADSRKSGASTTEQIVAGVGAIPNTVTQQSFLQGVQGVQDAIADPEKRGYKFIKSQASSVVPTISSDVAKASDPYQRQSDNITQAIEAKIPGLSKTLRPQQDAFGNPLERKASAIDTLINPFRPSNVKPKTELNSELRRLQDAKYGVMPDSTNKQFTFGSKKDGNERTINLTPQQLYDKNNQVGQLVQRKWSEIISTPEYANMSDYEKQQTLGNVLEDATALSKAQYAAKNDPALLDEQKLSKRQVNLALQDNNSQYLKTTASKEKTSYEYNKASSQRSLDMSRAYNANDLGTYQKIAMSELDALEKLKNSYDPDTEQDKINATIKKQESLARKLQGYLDKGYIKKGKSAKGKGGRKAKTNYAKQLALINGSANTKALRALVKRSKITRRKI